MLSSRAFHKTFPFATPSGFFGFYANLSLLKKFYLGTFLRLKREFIALVSYVDMKIDPDNVSGRFSIGTEAVRNDDG